VRQVGGEIGRRVLGQPARALARAICAGVAPSVRRRSRRFRTSSSTLA
jgi:hypothetical protein